MRPSSLRSPLFAPALLVPALLACGGATTAPSVPPAPALPAPPASAAPVAEPAPTPGAAAVFAALRDRVLTELLADAPSNARQLGLHEYDGQVAPISKDALAA